MTAAPDDAHDAGDARSALDTDDDAVAEAILALAAPAVARLPAPARLGKAKELGLRAAVLDAAVRAARLAAGEEQRRAGQRDELVEHRARGRAVAGRDRPRASPPSTRTAIGRATRCARRRSGAGSSAPTATAIRCPHPTAARARRVPGSQAHEGGRRRARRLRGSRPGRAAGSCAWAGPATPSTSTSARPTGRPSRSPRRAGGSCRGRRSGSCARPGLRPLPAARPRRRRRAGAGPPLGPEAMARRGW